MGLYLKLRLWFAVFVVCFSVTYIDAQTSWRGPQRDGIYPETGLLKSWPADGPELLLEITGIGKGYSSPAIVGSRLYITAMNEGGDREIFAAYTLQGEKIYETVYGTPWEKTYPETRTTPAIEGNKAYVISGSGEVVCINIEDGDIVWKVDGGKVFERKTGRWGTCESALVYDNKVIYTPGGEQTTMVALDAETGETVWKSRPLGDAGSYISPRLVTHNGKRQIIGVTIKNVIGVNPDTGNIEWTFDDWRRIEEGKLNVATNTPLYSNGCLFFSNGYDAPAFMLRLNDDATGVSVAWRNIDMDTHHGGFVLVDGIIYGSNFIKDNQGNWMALDWETGETKYETQWSGGKSKGSVISADGMLYCYEERRGIVALINPTPEKWDVVSEFRITKGDGPHWSHPVINDGVLYIRHGSVLMAYKIK